MFILLTYSPLPAASGAPPGHRERADDAQQPDPAQAAGLAVPEAPPAEGSSDSQSQLVRQERRLDHRHHPS